MKIKTRRLLSNFFAVLLSTTILLLSLENIRADEDISGASSGNMVYRTLPFDFRNEGRIINSDFLASFKSENQSIIVEFSSDNPNKLQALVGISNSKKGWRNSYFSIFMRDSGELGVEIRDAQKGINYLFERPASLWGIHKSRPVLNKVIFISDAKSKTYTMFANGSKIFSKYVDKFIGITDIVGQNSVSLGAVNREGKLDYLMNGRIEKVSFYNKALNDSEIKNIRLNSPYKLIFSSGDITKANYFRIPSLYTLKNGTVLASIDARYGGTHDSRSKINIATAFSNDNGQSWSEPNFAMKFSDYAEQEINWPRVGRAKDLQINGSASFIDSAIVQDTNSGKVILMADVMPAGIGNNNADKNNSGYKEIDGKFYLQLKKNNEKSYNYSVRENGLIYDDIANKPTGYRVNSKYEILQNNNLLNVEQYSVTFKDDKLIEKHNGQFVPMNIFYKDALFKIAPTNYLAIVTSDNNGRNWSDFKLLPPFLGVNHNAPYLSPGQGLALENSNRLIFASYTSGAIVYLLSDDSGETWRKVEAKIPFKNATAEAQMVELRPGVIRTYFRTTSGKIAYMTSYDSGKSWSDVFYLDVIKQTNYGTQVSVIKYSKPLNGKKLILLSTSNSTSGRNNGQIFLGFVNADDTVEWKHNYQVDLPKFGYAYSALTELKNGHIGLLFEKYDSWSRNELHLTDVVQYIDFEINDLLKPKK